ncbi:hypothetical protein EIP91_006411, partial [Steccherinum ochraceum]
MDAFRKIDIDQYEEDVLQEEELYEADPRDPATVLNDTKQKAGAVRGSLSKGDVVGALTLVLDNPPFGPNVEEAKNLNLQTLVSILNSGKGTEVPGILKALSPEAQDTLMKYLYKGMSLPGWGDVSGSILLAWHEKKSLALDVSPSQIPQDNDNHRTKFHASKYQPQHGISSSYRAHALPASQNRESTLFNIPAESLTHITSFLAPPALFALGRTNKQLHDHINDDNTWRRAYFCQFLGISPEDDLRDGAIDGGRSLMVRRIESTWKREYVHRWNLRRRYERSRSAPVTHVPVHSAVIEAYLMPSNPAAPTAPPGLLVASLQYGVVARSYPLTGKILRGYFDAAGTLNGLGVGNPNAEFSPDVSKVTIIADGGTAKILWGLRNGVVATTVASKALDISGRISGGKWVRCLPGQQHEGSVEDAVWVASSSSYCVTGGADGRVKLWETKRMTCLWTSERPKVHDPCVKVAVDLVHGVIASVMHSGQIYIWSGFEQLLAAGEDASTPDLSIREVCLPSSPRAVPLSGQGDAPPAREVIGLYLYCSSANYASVLSVFNNDTHFYRTSTELRTGVVDRMAYGDGNTGTLSAVEPVFGPVDTSFVITGDSLGCVTVYPWVDTCPTTPAAPLHKFEAHGNGSITALKWNSAVLVTGTSLGTASVWDSLDFTHLRSFSSIGSRSSDNVWDPVSRIIVEKDLLVMTAGQKVMAWLGGPVTGAERKGKHLKMSAKTHNSVAKWQRQVELYKDIADSRRELEDEQTHTRQVFGREREQMSQLDSLGLSEVEAVEYVLMLSRDEEERRRRNSRPRVDDDGVFIGDFDDLQTPVSTEMPFFLSGTNGTSSGSRSNHQSPRLLPRVAPSTSNTKVQVSPRVLPEPMEAGLSISPISRESSVPGSLSSSVRNNVITGDVSNFPTMSSTPTHSNGSGTPIRRAMSGSPESVRSAWSAPLRFSKSEGPSPPSTSSNASVSSSYRPSPVPGPSSPTRQIGGVPSGLSMSRMSAEASRNYASKSNPSSPPRTTQADADEREAEDL